MHSHQHITPALRVFRGADCLASLDSELKRLGSDRTVLVCGDWFVGSSQFERICTALGPRLVQTYAEVQGHSPVSSVEDAAQVMRNVTADAVVAVGGGSAIVTARAASILAAEGKPATALSTVIDDNGKVHSPRLLASKIPQVIVPTTPTTAIAKAGSAVFDAESGRRLAMYDPKIRVQSVFIDPNMLAMTPAALVASAGINTLSMAIEGLTSRSEDEFAQAALMHVLRLMEKNLVQAALRDDSFDARASLVSAAILCGQGTDHTAAGITTVLGHAIGARHEVENGTVNAIVLPHVLRFNAQATQGKIEDVAAALGLVGTAQQQVLDTVIEKVTTLLASLNMPSRLRDVGVPFDALPEISRIAMGDWFLKGNPRPVRSPEELQDILEKAW